MKDLLRRWPQGAALLSEQGNPESEVAVTAPDGRSYALRAIHPCDIERMKRAFARLSPTTVYRRFHGHVKELSDDSYRFLTNVDGRHHLALVALEQGEIVAVARYYQPEHSDVAEAAIVVTDDLQRRGLGGLVLAALVERATKNGIAGFEAFIQADNLPMRRMVERSGYQLHQRCADGVLHVWFRFAERHEKSQRPPEVIHLAGLTSLPLLCHGFCTRRGGSSPPPFDTFNCNAKPPGEDPNVRRNLETLLTDLNRHGTAVHAAVLLDQVHGAEFVDLDREPPPERINLLYRRADACLTSRKGLLLGVFTADCVPILMADRTGRFVAAAHSGWRGTAKNIAGTLIHALTTRGVDPAELHIGIGPAIAGACYEVGGDCLEAFATSPHLVPTTNGKALLELSAVITEQCLAAGVPASQLSVYSGCSHCDREQFFSYRRDGSPVGCQLSFAVLR